MNHEIFLTALKNVAEEVKITVDEKEQTFQIAFVHRKKRFITPSRSLKIIEQVVQRCVGAVCRAETLSNQLANFLPFNDASFSKLYFVAPKWTVAWQNFFFAQMCNSDYTVEKYAKSGELFLFMGKHFFNIPVFVFEPLQKGAIETQLESCCEQLVAKMKIIWELLLERAQIWLMFSIQNFENCSPISAFLAAQDAEYFEKGHFKLLNDEKLLDKEVTLSLSAAENEKMRLQESLLH